MANGQYFEKRKNGHISANVSPIIRLLRHVKEVYYRRMLNTNYTNIKLRT